MGVYGLGFGGWGLGLIGFIGLRVWGLGFLGLRLIRCQGFRVLGLGLPIVRLLSNVQRDMGILRNKRTENTCSHV